METRLPVFAAGILTGFAASWLLMRQRFSAHGHNPKLPKDQQGRIYRTPQEKKEPIEWVRSFREFRDKQVEADDKTAKWYPRGFFIDKAITDAICQNGEVVGFRVYFGLDKKAGIPKEEEVNLVVVGVDSRNFDQVYRAKRFQLADYAIGSTDSRCPNNCDSNPRSPYSS